MSNTARITTSKLVSLANAVRGVSGENGLLTLPGMVELLESVGGVSRAGTYNAQGRLINTWDELVLNNAAKMQGSKLTSLVVDTNSVAKIVFPDTIATLGSGSLYGFSKYPDLYFPDSIKTIESDTFRKYKSVNIYCTQDNYIKYYNGNSSFMGVSAVFMYEHETIITPEMLAIPGTYDYDGILLKSWEQLISDQDIIINNGDLEFKYESPPNQDNNIAFEGIYAIIFPDNLPLSNMSARSTWFNYWPQLLEIVLPNGLVNIPNSFITSCYHLWRIVIPETVTNIDNWAFWGNIDSKVLHIHYNGTATGAPWRVEYATIISD